MAWEETLVLSLWRIPVNVGKCEGIPTKFIEEVVLHNWLVLCQRGQCTHLGCDTPSIEYQDCFDWRVVMVFGGSEDNPYMPGGSWNQQKCWDGLARRENWGQRLSCLGGSAHVGLWRWQGELLWLCMLHAWCPNWARGIAGLRSGYPGSALLCQDYLCEYLVWCGGGKVVRMALRAYRAPRQPQASAWKVERSEWPPVRVLWPVRCICDSVP